MEVAEIRSVIKYFVIKGLKQKEIYDELCQTLGDACPSQTTVYKWAGLFKRGRRSVDNDPPPGRTPLVTSAEYVTRVHNIVLGDRRITMGQIAEEVGCSITTIHRILHNHLHMKKLSARWVPRMLRDDQKRKRRMISQQLLDQMHADKENFFSRIVTQDETWVHHFEPESKEQSKAWKHLGSPPPRKFKAMTSPKKIMASVFWDQDGIIMIDYLPKGETITGLYYAQELRKLRDALKKKRRGKLSRGVLLLQDNAPAHTSRVAVAAAAECGYEILPHPPYSPDLAPSDYHLFPKLKSELRGRRYDDDDDVMDAANDVLTVLPKEFFSTGIEKLEKKWLKCIRVGGDYVEK